MPKVITGAWVKQKINIHNKFTSDAVPQIILESIVPEGFQGTQKFDKVVVWSKQIVDRSPKDLSLKYLRLNVLEKYYYNYYPVRLPKFQITTTAFDLAPATGALIGGRLIFKSTLTFSQTGLKLL